MEGYVRPNNLFQWFKEGVGIITTNSVGKYTINYSSFPSPNAQTGDTSQATVSILTVSDIQFQDTGNYTCGVIGTQQVAQVVIEVEFGKIIFLHNKCV